MATRMSAARSGRGRGRCARFAHFQASQHGFFKLEAADDEVKLLDMKEKLRDVHSGSDERDADGGRFWTPIAFPAYTAHQSSKLHQEDAHGEYMLPVPDISNKLRVKRLVGDLRGQLRPVRS